MAVALAEEVARERYRKVAASYQSQASMASMVVEAVMAVLLPSQVNGLACLCTYAVVQGRDMEDCLRCRTCLALIVLAGPAYLAYLAFPAASFQVYQAGPIGTVAAYPCTYCTSAWRLDLVDSFFFVALLDFHRSVTLVELMA